MHNFKTKVEKMKKGATGRIVALVILITLLAQCLAMPAAACFPTPWSGSADSSSGGAIVNGFGGIDSDEIISSLRQDFFKTINEDLLMRVDEYNLSGPVDIIVTFTEKSLLDYYNQSGLKDEMTYVEFSKTKEAEAFAKKLDADRSH